METKTKKETRALAMHPKLLMDTIKRQAGTLQKANLEGVMNAIEAGSPVVRIDLIIDDNGKARLSIGDDGIGIETKKEMIAHFETFGTPHDASENTYWKQFRMGRGQMFAFGKNTWRTSTFQMEVDIDKNGLEYDLHEHMPHVDGCQIDIDLYKNPIGYSHNSIESYKECIVEQVKFMEGKILFNGEQINTPASECTWDFEDDNAYYLFNIGTEFKVYNLGAFVMNASLSDTGMMGIVVSKKQVKVNFARNDIQHDCPTYNPIKAVVKKNRIIKTRNKRRTLTPWERIATLKDIRDGTQCLDDVKSLALIPTAQGKHVSLEYVRKMKQQWCFSPTGDRFADRLMEQKKAVCLSASILTDLGYTGKFALFFNWLMANCGYGEWDGIFTLYCDFKELRKGINESFDIIPAADYTVSERRIVQLIQQMGNWNGRHILMGYSDVAIGWTDGNSYIAIERDWLRCRNLSWGIDISKLIMLMVHELAHDEDSRGTHIHGPEFYENMVRIMESQDSPLHHCSHFSDMIKSSKITEKRKKEDDKLSKAKQKVKEKLGLVAKVK